MIVGIDLGTTNSAVAIWRDGAAQLVPNSLGQVLTPSAVSVDEGGAVLVGLPARERLATHPARTATAFKRLMGAKRETQLGKTLFLPEELSSLVLGALKRDAEAFLGEPVSEAVITVPAYFNDKQRKATRRAGELAGLTVSRLVNEPTAAALAHGLAELEGETRFMVFDLGGGTFDVSVLEIFDGIIEVRASTGDNRLGGEDFNELIIDMMRARLPPDWRSEAQAGGALHARMRVAAERARRALTDAPSASFQLVWNDAPFEAELTGEAFEAAAEPLVARLREPVLRALRDGRVKSEELAQVVMVGGATRMPLVRRAVTRMFGRFPATGINPDEAVALGAAVQAGLKARDAALKEVVLTDVCPYSLGVNMSVRLQGGGLRHGVFAPIIERNTVVPASRAHTFTTLEDNQDRVVFSIYQGESRLADENILLGRMEAPVPRGPAGSVPIECRFTYDINGLLEVDLRVPKTGETRQLVILDEEGVSDAELAARRAALAGLKQHPREAEVNLAALARLGRCYEAQLGERREYVAQLATAFESVLERQDPREIAEARERLMKALDALEGETWL